MRRLILAASLALVLLCGITVGTARADESTLPGIEIPIVAPTTLSMLNQQHEGVAFSEQSELYKIFAAMDDQIRAYLYSDGLTVDRDGIAPGERLVGFVESPKPWFSVNSVPRDKAILYEGIAMHRDPIVLASQCGPNEAWSYAFAVGQQLNLTAEQQKVVEGIVKTQFAKAARTYIAYENQKSTLTALFLDFERHEMEATESH